MEKLGGIDVADVGPAVPSPDGVEPVEPEERGRIPGASAP
jgi:hypothetical protein